MDGTLLSGGSRRCSARRGGTRWLKPWSWMQVAISSAASISASVTGGFADSEVWARMLVRSWVVVARGVIVPNRVSSVVLIVSVCVLCATETGRSVVVDGAFGETMAGG